MKQNGVVKTVIVGSPEATIFTGRTGFTGEEKNNFEILKIAKTYPTQFIAFPTLNPRDPGKLCKLENYVRMGGKGLKLYSGHGSFHDLPLDHETMMPVYRFCEDNRIPILFHVNIAYYGNEFERVLGRFPRLKVICPHLCLATTRTDRFEYFMDSYSGLYTDISMGAIDFLKQALFRFSQAPDRYRELILKYQNRIFFGTDIVITDARYKTADWISKVTRTYRDLLERDTYRFLPIDEELKGFHLGHDVLMKVYESNFERFLLN
jgi:predicted TIM-barrel fold metal-dependent hydrolase